MFFRRWAWAVLVGAQQCLFGEDMYFVQPLNDAILFLLVFFLLLLWL